MRRRRRRARDSGRELPLFHHKCGAAGAASTSKWETLCNLFVAWCTQASADHVQRMCNTAL
eukprot:gene19887-biopygen14593